MSDGSTLRVMWREYVERHALDPGLVAVLARLAPAAPPVIDRLAAPPVFPQRPHTVSVVIPCYNYAHYLAEAVESAVRQTAIEVEVIIVDDCSTDDSLAVATGLADRDRRVRVLANQSNLGHVRSFNRGWEQSVGEFVVKLDADDLLAPAALARAAALFDAYPSVGLVYGHARHFWSDTAPAGRVHSPRWTVWRGTHWLAERCTRGRTAITNPEMVLRSALLREIGPMNPQIPYAPDMEISLRIAAVSDVGYIAGADQALHREHAGSMSMTDGSGELVDLHARLAAFESALADAPAEDREDLLATARCALSEEAGRYAAAARDRGRPSADYADLVAFAAQVVPHDQSEQARRRFESPGSRTLPRRVGLWARKALRAWRDEVLHIRWMVTGV